MILKDEADPVQVSAFLTGMRMKGETEEELEGFYSTALSRTKALKPGNEKGLDLGVNYDGKIKTLHILPSAVIITTACGLNLSSHGTEGVPAKFGPGFVKVLEKMTGRTFNLFRNCIT